MAAEKNSVKIGSILFGFEDCPWGSYIHLHDFLKWQLYAREYVASKTERIAMLYYNTCWMREMRASIYETHQKKYIV